MVAVLVFLVPVPGEVRLRVALPLQNWTAHIEAGVFDVLGADVTRMGNQLIYDGQPIQIIEKCNGLRMVFGLILVSYAFAFSLPLRNRVRLLILLVSPAAAILCNLIRILPTVWVYGRTTDHYAEAFHLYSGWLMLGVALLLLLGRAPGAPVGDDPGHAVHAGRVSRAGRAGRPAHAGGAGVR